MVKAGIITSVEERFFNQYKFTFLQKFIQQLMTFEAGTVDKVFELGFIKVITSMSNF